MARCKVCGAHGLLLKVNDEGKCLACVTKELDATRAKITPEIAALADLKEKIAEYTQQKNQAEREYRDAADELSGLQKQITDVSDRLEYESFGLYEPKYDFAKSEEYKEKLNSIRIRQKAMIKGNNAVICHTEWMVHDSKTKGKAMTKELCKLFLRAFNSECDDIVSSVKFSNIERGEQRIKSSYDAINKLGTICTIDINPIYFGLKLEELHLAYEYQCKKQEEKEAAAELRAQQREEAKAKKEMEEARKAAEKERKHYMQALESLQAQMKDTPNDPDLLEKQKELASHLDDINGKLEDIDYRQNNQRAGYVYIISNIGAFGEGVYKIGMTRRLDPMERVYELGDASVPFFFDVHAMIFSEDAPKLEASLHQAFADKRVNMVNTRREYFRVSLDEIKKVVRENHDKTVEFTDEPQAQQYRESLLMSKQSPA